MANRPLKSRWAIFGLIALLALAVRLPELDRRPMHTDEAVNAYIIGQLLAGQPYHYDPRDRHGPILSELTLPLVRGQGVHVYADLQESQLRLAPVLGGTVTVLLFGFAVETFGLTACLVAALLFAFGPLPLYYNRYFIHETFFVAATLGLLLALLRPRRNGSAVIVGLCAAMLVACKETAVIHLAALAVAEWFIRPTTNPSEPLPAPLSPQRFWSLAAAVFGVVGLLFFTWFGQDPGALRDLFHVAPLAAQRASGQGHAKPFWYFARLLVGGTSGWLVVTLALVGAKLQFSRAHPLRAGRFLALYTLIIFAIYSAIPYKTPWLALNFWLPLALFAGLGAAPLWTWLCRPKSRYWVVAGLLLAAGLIAHDDRDRVFHDPAGETNPYAYAHTTEDLLDLPDRITAVARTQGWSHPRIAVVMADAWPLPWYLRSFAQTGYWQPTQDPGPADLFVTTAAPPETLLPRLQSYTPEFYGVRPNVLLILWTPAH